jgi:hypothetical protein
MMTRRLIGRVVWPVALLAVFGCARGERGRTDKANVAAVEARATAQQLDD